MAVLSRPAAAAAAAAAATLAVRSTPSSSSAGHILWLLFVLAVAVFLLDKGCDWALDNLAQISALARIDQTLVALLTAGGEWEELAVVIAAVKQRRAALAIGNIIGSAISNILGAFSLGLLFAPNPSHQDEAHAHGNEAGGTTTSGLPAGFRYAGIHPETGLAIVRVEVRPRRGFVFDHSARTYATVQFLLTSVVAPLLYFAQASADRYGPIDRLPPSTPRHSGPLGTTDTSPSSSFSSEPRPGRRPGHRHHYAEWTPTALRTFAIALLIVFGVYILSIGVAIYRGWLAPPPASDSDSDSNSDASSSSSSEGSSSDVETRQGRRRRRPRPTRTQGAKGWWPSWFWTRPSGPEEATLVSGSASGSASHSYGATRGHDGTSEADVDGDANEQEATTTTNRVRSVDDASPLTHWLFRRHPNSRLFVIIPRLVVCIVGFGLLALSGSLLSSAGAGLATAFGWSETLFGLTVLSFLTTLPEKGLSLMAGRQGLHGALAGSAAGSNTFLLSLCAGVALLGLAEERGVGAGHEMEAQVPLLKWEEMVLLWLSSLALWTICLAGGRRWHGMVMLACYAAYLLAEMTVWRR